MLIEALTWVSYVYWSVYTISCFQSLNPIFFPYVSEAERSERNTFAERLSAVEAIANAISVVSSNGPGNRAGSSSSRR